MSQKPTYENLLTRLFSGTPCERAAVMDHLTNYELDRKASERKIRDH
jgi:hypothetical protein